MTVEDVKIGVSSGGDCLHSFFSLLRVEKPCLSVSQMRGKVRLKSVFAVVFPQCM